MQAVRDVLPLVINNMGIKKFFNAQSIMYHWPEIVGEKIAVNAYPIKIDRDMMFVAVTSSVWSHHLSMMKEDIVRKINNYIGEKQISDIRFQAGCLNRQAKTDDSAEDKQEDFSLAKIKLSEAEEAQAEIIVQPVGDAELRRRITRVIKKDIALKKFKTQKNWHKCAACTALCEPGQKYCTVCLIKQKEIMYDKVRKYIQDVPWIKYGEIINYVKCSREDYEHVRKSVIDSLLRNIDNNGDRHKMDVLTLVMLVNQIRPENVTQELVEKTLLRFRRKKYVSASGS